MNETICNQTIPNFNICSFVIPQDSWSSLITAASIIISALIALYTLYKNEKNKRSFLFMEKVWDLKFSRFEEIISILYSIMDIYNAAWVIGQAKLEKETLMDDRHSLVGSLSNFQAIENRKIIDDESYNRLIGSLNAESQSDREFLESIKYKILNDRLSILARKLEKLNEIRSRLNLVIFNKEILEKTHAIADNIVTKMEHIDRIDETQHEKDIELFKVGIKEVIEKMRKELITTLTVNVRSLPKLLKL
jgi:hypothetical protein